MFISRRDNFFGSERKNLKVHKIISCVQITLFSEVHRPNVLKSSKDYDGEKTIQQIGEILCNFLEGIAANQAQKNHNSIFSLKSSWSVPRLKRFDNALYE